MCPGGYLPQLPKFRDSGGSGGQSVAVRVDGRVVGRVALSCVASLSAPLSVSSSDESVFGSSSSASLSSSSDSDSVSGGAASWFLRLILYAPRSSHLRCKKLLALALVDGLWLLASSLIVVA